MASGWKDSAADVILRDGRSVHIRAIRPDDRAELARGFAQLSPEAVYFRFFRVKQRLTEAELAQFTEQDFVRRAALVANASRRQSWSSWCAARACGSSVLPPDTAFANPLDLRTTATPEHYERAVAAMGTDPGIDAVVVLYVPPVVTRLDHVAAAIARGAGLVPGEKPVLAVCLSARGAPALLGTGPREAIPSYSFPENAAEALAGAVRWNQWRARVPGTALVLATFAREAIRAVVDRVLATIEEPTWLEPEDLVTILRAAGIGFAEIVRTTQEEAVGAAPRLGYPLVAKALSPGLRPGSELRGVEVGLDGPDALEAAIDRLATHLAEHGRRLDGVLLQREVTGGIEAGVGVTTDPTFGPLVACSLGGPFVELLGDVSYRVPPVTDSAAEEMVSGLRAARLLSGYRGTPPADRAALVSVVQRVSALVEIVPELLELDLRPVKVLAPGRGALVVDGRMRIGPIGPRL